jgi:hypothetical protein
MRAVWLDRTLRQRAKIGINAADQDEFAAQIVSMGLPNRVHLLYAVANQVR